MFTYTKTTIINGKGKSVERELTAEEIKNIEKSMDDISKDNDNMFKEFNKFTNSFSVQMDKMFSKISNMFK
jgi:hypothetical protein